MKRKKGLSLMKRNAFFSVEHGHCLVRSIGTLAVRVTSFVTANRIGPLHNRRLQSSTFVLDFSRVSLLWTVRANYDHYHHCLKCKSRDKKLRSKFHWRGYFIVRLILRITWAVFEDGRRFIPWKLRFIFNDKLELLYRQSKLIVFVKPKFKRQGAWYLHVSYLVIMKNNIDEYF